MAITPTTLLECFEGFANQSGDAKNMPAFDRAYLRVQKPLDNIAKFVETLEVIRADYERAKTTDKPVIRQEAADAVNQFLGALSDLNETLASPHKKGG